MASPITHVVLTEKIFYKFFNNEVKKDFFVGTLLPDIRYLKVIDRSKTHFHNLTIADVQNNGSFLAGLKFHGILDIAREKFMADNGVYTLCPKSKYIIAALKILEDEVFYRRIADWSEYINYLEEILPDEISFGIKKTDIKKWHWLLQQYFQQPPDRQIVYNFMHELSFPDVVISEINDCVGLMRENQRINGVLNNLYDNFVSLMT